MECQYVNILYYLSSKVISHTSLSHTFLKKLFFLNIDPLIEKYEREMGTELKTPASKINRLNTYKKVLYQL